MSTFYMDTSALAKYYIDEIGSNWLRTLIDADPQPVILSSQLLIAEITSAFQRRLREKAIDLARTQNLQNAFRRDCLFKYTLQPINMDIINLATTLLARHRLRTLDALHLATALTANQVLVNASLPSLTFVCADNRLNSAATAEGLAIENPNLYS